MGRKSPDNMHFLWLVWVGRDVRSIYIPASKLGWEDTTDANAQRGSGFACMRAPWLWLWLVPWLACSRGATIIVEHECGDLCPTTEFLNDGECDDGGPTSKYFECPRFSDATDCQTQCRVFILLS